MKYCLRIIALSFCVIAVSCGNRGNNRNSEPFPSVDKLIKAAEINAEEEQVIAEEPVNHLISGSEVFDNNTGNKYYYVIADPKEVKLALKDANDSSIVSFRRLKTIVEEGGHRLLFAMNGGMYSESLSPIGLYVENGKKHRGVAKVSGSPNFGMFFGDEASNGIFMIDKEGKASVIKSRNCPNIDNILYATQSGPLMVSGGVINSRFTPGSKNRLRRNGIGVDKDGKVVMIMADNISFYDFACLFKDRFHCDDATYLDGVVSLMYIAGGDIQSLGGYFGVMVYVEE